MQTKEYWFIFLTALIPIIFWNFYWYVGFNANLTKMFTFIFGLGFLIKYLTAIFSGLQTRSIENPYTKQVSLFIIVIFISIINAWIYWGQSPNLTYRSGINIFVLVSYFYFLQKKPEQQLLEKTVFLLACIYIILWLYALSQVPNVVFGNREVVGDDRGFYRILQLAGLDTVAFTYFYCISHTSNTSGKNKYLLIVVAIICFITIFLSLTRIIIIATIAISAFYVVRKKSLWFIILSLTIVIASSQYLLSINIVSSLIDMTLDPSTANRTPEYTLAFKLYPFHIGTFLFGNGSEHIASSYGQMEAYFKSTYIFHRSDAGYVGVYVTYGITGVILLLSILWKVIRQNVSDKSYYLKLFVLFIFFVNISAYHFADYGFTLVLSLYLLSKDSYNSKK